MNGFDVIVLNNLGGGQSVQVPNLPTPGESVKGSGWRYNIDAGKGPNSAICMSRLGAKVAFIGKAGQDEAGNRGEQWMQEAGVDTSGLLRTAQARTGQGIRIMGPNGRHMVICGESCSWTLTEEEVCRELDRLQPARYFFTGLEIRMELALAALKYAKSLGMQTVLNLSPVPKESIGALDFVDYLAVNEVEGAQLVGISDWHQISPAEITRRIAEQYDCDCVLLTLGANGCVGRKGERFWSIPRADVQTIDTIGAGDGYLSAFTVNLTWGADEEQACRWANEFAGYTTTREGSIPSYPLLKEIAPYIKERLS